jgi:hypothetical protein
MIPVLIPCAVPKTAGPKPSNHHVYTKAEIAAAALSVDPLFKTIFLTHSSKLGMPQGPSAFTKQTFPGAAYQAWYENAMVLFFVGGTRQFYILPPGAPYSARQDSEGFNRDPRWNDLSRRKELFPQCALPPALPPFGGIASGGYLHPQMWCDLGCLKHHCVIAPRDIRVERFEYGYIIGPYRRSFDDGYPEAYVLIDGQAWESVSMEGYPEVGCSPIDGDVK